MAKTPSSTSSTSRPAVAVAYARCSTGMQEHSVADQIKAVVRWCAGAGHALTETFSDDGVSGGDLERDGLLAMFDHIEANPGGGYVVVWDTCRLARPDDPIDGLMLERRIAKAGWTLHYLNDAPKTGDALADTLLGVVRHHGAGQYRRTLALSTTRGAASSMATGSAWRGPTPYAYSKRVRWADGRVQVVPRGAKIPTRDAEAVKLVPGDAREVETLRWIFDEYVSGRGGFPLIAAKLTAMAAPSPGPSWNVSTVKMLLMNPVYAGDVTWNRKHYGGLVTFTDGGAKLSDSKRSRMNARADWVVARDAHEALVPRETWEQAQAIRTGRGSKRGGARLPARYPLSGLLTCGCCSGPYVMKNTHRYKAGVKLEAMQARYRCSGPDPARACKGYSIHEDVIEAAVRAALSHALARYRTSARLRAEVVRELAAALGTTKAPDVSKLAAEERDLTARINRTVALLPDVDPDTARDLAAKVKGWRARLADLQAEQQRQAAAPRSAGVDPEALADRAVALFDAFKGLPKVGREARRAFYADVLERVTVRHETRQAEKRTLHVPVGGEVVVRGPLAMLCAGEVVAGRACTSTTYQALTLPLPAEVLQLTPAAARAIA